jgi:hypothetical protein
LCCPLIAASSFGFEFSNGTLAQLLSQPVDRRRLWFEKMLTLGAMLAPLALVSLLIYFGKIDKPLYWLLLLIPVCCFCATPFFTFLTRGTMGGVVLSIAAPMVIFLGGGALILWLFKKGVVLGQTQGEEAINEQKLFHWLGWYFGIAMTVYCGTFYYLGYRWFQRLQVADMVERQIGLGAPLHRISERLLDQAFTGKFRYLAALLGKELHLQQNAVTLWLAFTAIQITAVVFINVAHPESGENYFIVPLAIYVVLMPLVIGGCAIAEERKFGVRAWHLTLPTSYRTQWLAKLAVVFTITALLGMAVPFAWCCLCPSLCPSLSPLGKPSFDSIVPLIATPLLVTAVALYASSFARDTLRAILGALGICAGFGLAVDILSQAAGKVEPFSVPLLLPLVERLADGVQNLRFQPAIWTAVSVISLVLLVSLLVGAFFHFRAFERTS